MNLSMRQRRAIIIGAGLAGLASAYELTKSGWDVLVLEGTGRPGGRVLTIRDHFLEHQHAEAGAEGINAKHAFVLHYTREFDLPLKQVKILGERAQTLSILSTPWSVRLRFRGRVYTIPKLLLSLFNFPYQLRLRERLVFPLGLTDLYTRPFERKFRDIAAPLQEDLLYLDSMSFRDFLVEQGASEEAIALIEEHHLFSSLGNLSALYMVWEQARRDFDDRFYRIAGGNDRLPNAFADRLGNRIRYDATVLRVAQGGDGVAVTYSSPAGTSEVSGDCAVCTLSLPVCRRVVFQPALSAGKRRALEQIRYTSLFKTQLQFETRFWERSGWSGVGYSDRPLQYLLNVTTDQPGRCGILTSFATGQHAQQLAAMGDDAISCVRDMIAELDPAAAHTLARGHIRDWDSDPWTGGTHPQFEVGQMTAFWPELGRTEGRIHFAGEHTSYWTGWMNGALESADRVRREILAASTRDFA